MIERYYHLFLFVLFLTFKLNSSFLLENIWKYSFNYFLKYIKIIYFFIFYNLFLILINHQVDNGSPVKKHAYFYDYLQTSES
jgi:hypothetical protein